MPTLEELMAEVLDTPSQTQTKEASVKSASTEEIDRVLEGLGLSDGDAVKTASETLNDNGGNMSGSLTDLLYSELLGEKEEVAAVEKTASEGTTEVTETSDEAVSGLVAFGEAPRHFFKAAVEVYFDKVAGDLMSEAKGMSNPDPVAPSAVGKSLGANASPRLHTNHSDATAGQKPDVTTQNHGAYDQALKEKAAILSRIKGHGQIGTKKV